MVNVPTPGFDTGGDVQVSSVGETYVAALFIWIFEGSSKTQLQHMRTDEEGERKSQDINHFID